MIFKKGCLNLKKVGKRMSGREKNFSGINEVLGFPFPADFRFLKRRVVFFSIIFFFY
jgi:hypothetical protein